MVLMLTYYGFDAYIHIMVMMLTYYYFDAYVHIMVMMLTVLLTGYDAYILWL